MKNTTLLIGAFLTLSTSIAFAGWTETVECSVSRGSVDSSAVVNSRSSAQLVMEGPHNGEYGKVAIRNALTPAYSIVFEKVSSGRTDYARLTTRLGNNVVAKSSVDLQRSTSISNSFLTSGTDYQITVSCTSEIK